MKNRISVVLRPNAAPLLAFNPRKTVWNAYFAKPISRNCVPLRCARTTQICNDTWYFAIRLGAVRARTPNSAHPWPPNLWSLQIRAWTSVPARTTFQATTTAQTLATKTFSVNPSREARRIKCTTVVIYGQRFRENRINHRQSRTRRMQSGESTAPFQCPEPCSL